MSKSLSKNMGEDLRIRLSKSSITSLERDAVDRVLQAESWEWDLKRNF